MIDLGEPIIEHDGSRWVDYDMAMRQLATQASQLAGLQEELARVKEIIRHSRYDIDALEELEEMVDADDWDEDDEDKPHYDTPGGY